MKPTPILFLGDNPASCGGLGRILRDIATHAAAMPEFRVGSLARVGQYSRYLPWAQYSFWPNTENMWGEETLADVWQDFAGSERGIVMSVWDATRLTWLGMPQSVPESAAWREFVLHRPFRLWGYFPVEAVCATGRAPTLGLAAVRGFDRVLAYSRYGAAALGTDDWAPHGLDMDVWKPQGRAAGREFLRSKGLRLCDDDVLVGVVATNQPRKDWGLTAAVMARLKQHYGVRFKGWWHTDVIQRDHSWNMLALLSDFRLNDSVALVIDDWRDEEMALAYSACNVTLAPGMEGFGYPAAESQACGTPVITGAGHGGSEFVTEVGGILMSPVGDRLEGPHNVIRHIHNPESWCNSAIALVEDNRDPRTVAKSAEYLSWQTLWPGFWAKFLRAGLK